MWSRGLMVAIVCLGLSRPVVAEDRVTTLYHPLTNQHLGKLQPFDITIRDESRQRDIPIRVYRSDAVKSAPVILFSHGLGGSREGSVFLGEHWAARGYIAVFLQHPGSDTSVWQGKRLAERMGEMKKAAGWQNFLLRAQDVPAVLDQLEKWNCQSGHELFETLDLEKVGMSGHSFGAVTTQAVSGQSLPRGGSLLTESRIKAALLCSPSIPVTGDPQTAFGSVNIPWMLMTGTHDSAPIGTATPENRRLVYSALPPGGKYEVVLDQAEHSVFTDRALPGEQHQRNPNHHRVILALKYRVLGCLFEGK